MYICRLGRKCKDNDDYSSHLELTFCFRLSAFLIGIYKSLLFLYFKPLPLPM